MRLRVQCQATKAAMEHCWCSYVLGILSIYTGLGQNAKISVSPTVYVASLNQFSDVATFICRVSPSTTSIIVLNILVDGKQVSAALKSRGISAVRQSSTEIILTIEPRAENNNTQISCVAALPLTVIQSEEVTLLIQGLLSPPSDLEVVTVGSRPGFKTLSWQPPYTLDITNVEQDITGYRVCFTFSATEVCTITEDAAYEFLSVSLPLEFRVTAINAVGESNFSHTVHQACEDMHVRGPVRGFHL